MWLVAVASRIGTWMGFFHSRLVQKESWGWPPLRDDDTQDVFQSLNEFDKLCERANGSEFQKLTNLKKCLTGGAYDTAISKGGDDYASARAVLLKQFISYSEPSRMIGKMNHRKKGTNIRQEETYSKKSHVVNFNN